mmetsp:Transcript_153471/g.491900  ORF Transcript_153471/g.491900 Transcript_153471/m.491900 type:complete len:298 (-) Transcript_153471:64-957(-)|eukprot:CAMPEP_0204157976 /NCGR_PEP_ID=MMETSP0361-20130328/31709_1 /ASSEMBLY_ACC=CAM_ASM_000343 /TAXON_ID=268821 /ORGANISM="Scrippsiella Hangoei, Strain SHTV-5" /LENGTH=297 /DNA_ID=CAMNT_0051113833 /DNA_START=55 /DNA_END=948 /DNA_ORIENTATION=+
MLSRARRFAPLLVEAVSGAPLAASVGQTVADVPKAMLSDARELAMVVLVDRKRSRVLLEVPNTLGWRLHFGCSAPDDDLRVAALTELTASGIEVDELCEKGLMLFTFCNVVVAPIRVRVFEAMLRSSTSHGRFFDFGDVPYDRMWADDVVWMPALLLSGLPFSGRFVFDCPPSATSRLILHNYESMRQLIEVSRPSDADFISAQSWPVWSCAAEPDPCGTFVESRWWDMRPGVAEERCLIIAGRATLEIGGEQDVVIEAGDWVSFKAGFSCTWHVEVDISKHYEYFDVAGKQWTSSE